MSQPQENESLAGVMRNPSKVALLRVSSAALNNESIIEILDDLDTLIMNQHIHCMKHVLSVSFITEHGGTRRGG